MDIDYRNELQDLISVHCGKEGMFFSLGVGSVKTYRIVGGEEIAAELLKIVENTSGQN